MFQKGIGNRKEKQKKNTHPESNKSGTADKSKEKAKTVSVSTSQSKPKAKSKLIGSKAKTVASSKPSNPSVYGKASVKWCSTEAQTKGGHFTVKSRKGAQFIE